MYARYWVYTKIVIKTIHAEKDIFSCSRINDPIGSVFRYKDVTIYTEVFGSGTGPEFFPGLTQFKVTVCDRDPSGDLVSCNTPVITALVSNLTRCSEEKPISPLKMNSLSLNETGKSIPAKSIVSEKHVYKCVSREIR